MKALVFRVALTLFLGFVLNAGLGMTGHQQAQAQVLPAPVCPPICPPPPPPPPPPTPSPADTSDHGGHRGKFTVDSFLHVQAASIACSAVVNIGDSTLKAHGRYGRELTPVGVIDNSAACLFVPAMVLKGINWAMGVKDNACSLDVARRALRENNSAQAKQELLWRDGSFERRQAKFLDQYAACYRRK